MTTYADPTRCPDCRAVLPQDPQVCPACALPLTGETAISLFSTFMEADRLLGVLRSQKCPAPATVAAHHEGGSLLEGVTPYPAAGGPRTTASRHAPRVSGASVPKILLSLGALCLLVAAVTFLAVAWSWLGVGGRTVVLVVLTGTALGLCTVMHRRNLRMAAESLSVVGLGLLTLDVVGLDHAGWLGDIDGAHLTLCAGAVVATGALLMLVATSRRPLTAPALIAPVAVLVAGAGASADAGTPLPMLVTVLVLLALGRVGTLLPSGTLQVTSIVTAVPAWLALTVAGLDHAGDPVTVGHYVGALAAWPLLAATVVAAAVGPVTGARRADLIGYSVAGLVGSYAALLPVLHNAETAMVSAVLATSALWVIVTVIAPPRLRPAALLPLGGTLVVPTVAAALMIGEAVRAVLSVGSPFTRSFGVQVAAGTTSVSPLLIVPTLLTLAAAASAAARLVGPVRTSTWDAALAGAVVLGGVATLPLYDAPLAVVVGVVLATAVAGFFAAERMQGSSAHATRVAALVTTTAAALLALPSDRMTTAVLALACVLAGYLMLRTDATAAAASACFPAAFAGLVWAGGNASGIDGEFRAIPVLVVLGGLAIWRPQVELEMSSAVSGAFVSAAAIGLASDLDVALAVHLTVAGTLVTVSSLIHPSRRVLAWPGGLLLAAATWVRLIDLGVQVPEAYTLPSALVLVGVGVWHLRGDDRSATLRYVAPGLSLATVPSLLATLDDPYSLRALLLGVACLALTVSGVALRWSAPVVVGATVGALLVLRELAPYAAQVPTWLTIGVSGALLLTVGITWESRINDVRRAAGYVAALR